MSQGHAVGRGAGYCGRDPTEPRATMRPTTGPQDHARASLIGRKPGRLLALALVAALAACSGPARPAGRPGETGSPIRDLHSVSDLEARFNADVGSTRLILLLSPT
jgi:hypothetical protein